MRLFATALMTVLMLCANVASAQQVFSPVRVTKITNSHTTVGTATALAIPAASVGGNLLSWKVCNDAVNSSTYLIVGFAADAATDGTTLLPGACYECENCTPGLLKLVNVKGQAAANGYSVIQYRQ